MSERNVPAVRFEGFSGEWANDMLGELAIFSKGKGFSKSDLINEGYPIILYGRLYTKYETIISEVDTFIANNSNAIISKGNEVIVPASGETAEDISRASVVGGKGIVLGGDLNIIYPNKDLFPIFLALSISNGTQQREMMKRAQGKSVVHLHNSDLSEIKLKYPQKLEQSKIGEFFKNLDNLIAQNQKKYDKLVNMKKACLDKMFPKDGADTPEVRFKGLSGKWEENPLLDSIDKIVDFRGRTPKKLGLDWSENGYLALSALNVKMGYIDKTIDAHYGDEELYNIWMKGNELHKGQVLFTTEAPMGNVAQISDDCHYILSQRTIAFEINKEIIKEDYLALILSAPFTYVQLFSMASGGTAKGVSQKSLSELKIKLPSDLDEQTQIGNFFQNLDSLIALQKTKLEKLKNIKKACLDKMFI